MDGILSTENGPEPVVGVVKVEVHRGCIRRDDVGVDAFLEVVRVQVGGFNGLPHLVDRRPSASRSIGLSYNGR